MTILLDQIGVPAATIGASSGSGVQGIWYQQGVTSAVSVLAEATFAAQMGRTQLEPPPRVHTTLWAVDCGRVKLIAQGSTNEGRGMDGVSEITVNQMQRVTFRAFAEDSATPGVALTQADVQSIQANVFLPDERGDTPVGTFFPIVADSIYDTVQKDGIDPEGWNVEVLFDMVSEAMDGAPKKYVLEVVLERKTTGERLPFRGRVVTKPVLSLPI